MAENNFADSEEMNINSDSDIPGNTHLSNPLEEDNAEGSVNHQAQLDEQKDKYIRLLAEFDNYKRRSAKERLEYMQTAGKDIIVSLLGVLDDVDRAEKQVNAATEVEQVKQGVQLVFNKLRTVLSQKGLKAMESVGQDFDVEQHEGITQIDGGAENAGKVIDEIEKGYFLNDKIIRFAKVVVGK